MLECGGTSTGVDGGVGGGYVVLVELLPPTWLRVTRPGGGISCRLKRVQFSGVFTHEMSLCLLERTDRLLADGMTPWAV